MTILIVCQILLGAAMAVYAGSYIYRAFDEDDWTYLFFAGLFFVLSIVNFNFAISNIDKLATENAKQEQSICEQIPDAQWISDNKTCIKDGRVILS